MPDQDPPPQCDANCQKIILNGTTPAHVLESTYEEYATFKRAGGNVSEAVEMEMIKQLNHIEDLAFKFRRTYLEGIGYKGPWPHSMTG